MEQIHERVAGLDVHRDSVAACVRVPGLRKGAVTHKQWFSTMTAGLGQLRDWLAEHRVEVVGMEATGVYWKPPFYALEGQGFELWLCNAQHVKNVPGGKTDMFDAAWLADVCSCPVLRTARDSRDTGWYRATAGTIPRLPPRAVCYAGVSTTTGITADLRDGRAPR